MNFALLGGDDRSVRLAGLLREDGHAVRPFALEWALPCVQSAAEALDGADCAVLPLPCEKDGALNAPLSAETYDFPTLLTDAAPGLPVLAGKAGEALRSVCRRQRLPLSDYFLQEAFVLRNAELTAEGCVSLLLDGEDALRGSRVLISGYGRIGRLLAQKLLGLGVRVTVAARSAAQRTLAELVGCRAIPFSRLGDAHWDAVVNTVPATIFGAAEIEELGDARCIELASAPYGFDLAAAKRLGKDVILAAGLPGKTAPAAAAKAVRDAVYAVMEAE